MEYEIKLMELEAKMNKLVEKINKLEKSQEALTDHIDNTTIETTELWKLVLNYPDRHNEVHSKFNISQMSVENALKLCRDLTENCYVMNDLFHLEIYVEEAGKYSGCIYQSPPYGEKDDILQLTIDELTL